MLKGEIALANRNSGDKTKLMLANSLRKLMKKKALDKIKIREIVEDCNVNRQTFYYHFQDIYALVEWMYTYDGKCIVEEYRGSGDVWGTVKALFDYLETHHEEIHCVVNSKADKFFHDFVHEQISLSSRLVIDTVSKNIKADDYHKDFLAGFYTYAICGVVEDWMRNRGTTRMSSDELIHLFYLTVRGNVIAALRRFEAEKNIAQSDNV